MPTAHMIHGYLGSGKTRFAVALATEVHAMRFTHDEFMSVLYGRDPDPALFEENRYRVDALIDILWKRAVQAGADVVLDLNFWSRRQRDQFRQAIAELGCAARLYNLVCPEEIALARVLARNNEPDNALYISEATYHSLKSRFEPLEDDEAREEIATG